MVQSNWGKESTYRQQLAQEGVAANQREHLRQNDRRFYKNIMDRFKKFKETVKVDHIKDGNYTKFKMTGVRPFSLIRVK